MYTRSVFANSLLAVLVFVCVLQKSYAQADPVWLKRWNISQSNRPEQLESHSRISSEDEPGYHL